MINTESNFLESINVLGHRHNPQTHLGRLTSPQPLSIRDARDVVREAAKELNLTGTLKIRLWIDETGHIMPERTEIEQTPSDSLAQIAIRELQKQEWEPAYRADKLLKWFYVFSVDFR